MSRRIFAIIPAAGWSRRMGQPKLLLPWRGSTIMDTVVAAWVNSKVSHVVAVIRKGDEALWEVCRQWPIDIVRPSVDPDDMKGSVQCGLRHVAEVHRPASCDQWMVAPADLPRLGSELIDRVIDVGENAEGRIIAPRFGERQGHPVLFPWSASHEVFELAQHEGINQILAIHGVDFVDLPSAARVTDVDTPGDYRELGNRSEE